MVRRFIPSAVFVLLAAAPAPAVVILTEAGSRVAGYVVADDGTTLTLRESLPDGKEHRFPKAKVVVVQAVKPDRLAALRPEEPQGYRDYAEELAAKREDPEARDAAIRLYVIAAYLDPDGLGRGCLRAAAPLARTPQEARRFRALAFLLDPDHDPAVLKEDAPAVIPPKPARDPAWPAFVAALRAYRKGDYAEALALANEPGVAKCFAAVPGFVSHKEFVGRCEKPDDPERPPDPRTDLVRKIVRVELAAEEAAAPLPADPKARPAGSPWAGAADPTGRVVPPALTLETLTEFDPRDCVFRAGKWQRPDKRP